MAAAAAAAEQQPRAAAPVLRYGSQNCNGLATAAKAAEAAGHWRRAGYHVVLVQEHHLTLLTSVAVARRLRQLGWAAYFAFSPPGASGRGRGGTAILIRSSLLSSDSFTIVGGDAAVRRAADGRYIAMPARWCGHHLHIASVYLPNDSTAQRQLIAERLQPLYAAAAAAGKSLLWGGDFNFAPNLHLDRLGYAVGAQHADVGTQQRWQQALPGLRDAFRARHPHRRAFTYVHGQHASRIDRFYVSPPLLSYVAVCSVRRRTFSDHCPVSLALVGLLPAATGPGLRRARLAFLSSPSLHEDMQSWLSQQLPTAPDDDHAFLVWWPSFKRAILTKCGELYRSSRLLSRDAEAAGAELEALHAQLDAGNEAVLPAIIAARQRFVAAARTSEAAAALQRRQAWLHERERPHPALTRRLRPRQQDRAVPALRSANGQLLQSGSACAQRVATYWAGVSAQPATSPAAQQEVLAALAGARRLSTGQAAQLAQQAVEQAEVKQALRTAKPGRAPGLDGIPVELYRRFKDTFIPLLARLFTSIATLGDLPAGFHDGLITIVYKRGERSDPANYRPITLLNTDYRLYAKVLALRLNPCLSAVIDPEQTAFVPGREIGENILTLQCLPHLLRRQGRWAVVVFCDFRKAYDTVDRGFLFTIMHELGVGEGFIAMVRLLLTGTRARAMVNGHVSTPAASAAGVRQGCPLAPLLYLFVAQALQRLLKARGIGIDIAGRRLAALQYADDAEALLPSLAQVPHFISAMQTFGDATGQHLHHGKTELLPIGNVPAALPDSVHGLRVVSAATSLGMSFGSTAAPAAAWPDLLEGVKGCYARLASLPRMSVFGRGFASAAYGVSKVLYHAEFTGLPPAAALAELQRVTAKVVSRGQAPADTTPRFAGLAGWVLPGRPAEGGFGTLPWEAHICSRHAKWGLRLVLGPADLPWIVVARALLHCCAGAVAAHPLGLLMWPAGEGQHLPGMAGALPAPLRRLHEGLHALPPVADVAGGAVAAGPWCWAAPLWGNPFFCSAAFPGGIDSDFYDFAAAGVTSIGQLLHIQQAVAATPGPAAYTLVWHALLQGYAAFANRFHTTLRIGQLLDALPAAWVAAARDAAAAMAAGMLAPPQLHDALGVMLPRLGWLSEGEPLRLSAFTVRAGTDMQMVATYAARRQQYLVPFSASAVAAADAGAGAAAPAAAPVHELLQVLRRLWRLRWENEHKEPFWRLVYDAFPTAARLHVQRPCCCGAAAVADRHHHFWECPVAQAVVGAMSAAAAAPLTKPNVWLARPPPAVYSGVWTVAVLAAVSAMDHGRRRMYALSTGPAPATPIHVICARSAVARFWALLADFVALRCAPASWQAHVPPGHPFIHFDPQSNSLAVHPPPPAH